jgi:aminomuconate-semialdehyde/2-hydroxymuconate-6-semialdehyde dehydrogenase
MAARSDELATLDTTNMGKPLPRPSTTSTRSVGTSASSPTTSGTTAARSTRWIRATMPTTSTGRPEWSRAISPWNFPLMMASWKIAPAIAWGNYVHHQAVRGHSGVVTLLGRLAGEAGFPRA